MFSDLDTAAADSLAASALLARLADRWTIPMLHRLIAAPLPLAGLRRALPGITQRGLMITLNGLERDGLAERVAAAGMGEEALYGLTERGRALLPLVAALTAWAGAHAEGIAQSRTAFDRAQAERASILPRELTRQR